MTDFLAFGRAVNRLAPRIAVVLGSGLSGVTSRFREEAAVAFHHVPGLVPPTVFGHSGRMAVGTWDGVPALFFLGRLHSYEGHLQAVITRSVRLAAESGIRILVLTNAAGGINPALSPGSLMVVRRHMKLLQPEDWRAWARDREAKVGANCGDGVEWPYSSRLLGLLEAKEKAAGRPLFSGTYAAMTGPCYETPAEIRGLAARGADAVGMSTALEAEAVAALGLEVAAISCITNAAAGLAVGVLGHADVLTNARLGVERLGELLGHLISGGQAHSSPDGPYMPGTGSSLRRR